MGIVTLFNLYTEYIMRNAGLDEGQAGNQIAWRNNKLRFADDTTLMAESEEELKSLLMKEKEESEKFGLKLNIQKTEIMASSPITSRQIDRETMETLTAFLFLIHGPHTCIGIIQRVCQRCRFLGLGPPSSMIECVGLRICLLTKPPRHVNKRSLGEHTDI